MANKINYEHPMLDQVLGFIVEWKKEHDGNSPPTSVILEECGISSTSMVRHYLKLLEERGDIKIRGTCAIEVNGGEWNLTNQFERKETR